MKAIVGVLVAAAVLAATDAVQAQSSGTPTPLAATTQAAPPPASSPTGPNSADGQKMVCRSGRLIGSRLPAPTVCKTQWQWDEQRRIARKEIEYDQIRGYSGQ